MWNKIKQTGGIALVLFFLLSIKANGTNAQNRSISFEDGTWEEIKQKAQKENKPIFVDAYATWCGPCKWMAKNVFTNDTIADYYNSGFINVKMDMEKGEGIELAKEWKVQAYPTLMYFSSEGELLHRVCGAYEVAEFVDLGKDALDPEKQLGVLIKKFEEGNRESDFLADYIIRLAQSCMGGKTEAEAYFITQKDEELSNERNWKLINLIVTDINSREFRYLEKNQPSFEKLYTQEAVRAKIEKVYSRLLSGALYKDEGAGYPEAKKEILARKNSQAEKAVAGSDLAYYELKKDWGKYAVAAEKYINTYSKEDYNILNNIAWKFFENITDKKHLNKALTWAKRSVEINENVFNLDTYAHLLYATGNKVESIDKEKRAIEIAKETGDPILSELEDNLKKFEGK